MKIICVGRNYVDHIKELKNKTPKEPIIFFKPTITLNSSSIFKMPDFSSDIHHEIEVIFEIGKKGKKIGQDDSLSFISNGPRQKGHTGCHIVRRLSLLCRYLL